VEDSIMKIAPGIHRIGDNSMINAYLIEQAGEVTIIDAGVSGFYQDIDRELAAMGRTPADVRALVLTHGHTDHIGFAERLRRERGVPVSVHEADAALARGEVPNPSKGFGPVKLGPLLGFLWFSALHGGLRTPKLQQVTTFGDGATLDVPGSPRVILTPGHTPGSAALQVASLGALFVGDAFATYAVTTGTRGPQVAPFTADAGQAVESLARLDAISADRVLPGHGDPGRVASRKRSARYASGTTAAIMIRNPAMAAGKACQVTSGHEPASARLRGPAHPSMVTLAA
jgi:glyoxylase-like metal-dependent hydrolase (beta-lactamase superfamily II)